MWQAWQKASNDVQIYDTSFDAQSDSFEIIFEDQYCRTRAIPVTEVKPCNGQIKFCFDLDCELPAGEYKATIRNITTDQEFFTCTITIYC